MGRGWALVRWWSLVYCYCCHVHLHGGKVVLEAGVDCRDVGVYRSTCGCGCGCRWLKCLCLVALLLAYISLISNYKNGKLHSIAVALSQWDNRRAGAWIYASQLALSPSPPLAVSLSPSLPVLRV